MVISMLIDTHCHLSREDYENVDEIVKNNRKAGINKIIISGCTRDSIEESLEMVMKYDDVYATIGYHPSEADIVDDDDIMFLKNHLTDSKVLGIGEIGLDFHYGKKNADEQKELFRKQLKIASDFNLPVVIHSRDATLDTINILKEFPDVKGDIHCFSGSKETAISYISMGYYLGIGGVVTFKNSKLIEVVKEIGLDRVLLETDSPYLTPEPYRGKVNSSKYIVNIVKFLSEKLDVPVDKIGEITSNNAFHLFDLK